MLSSVKMNVVGDEVEACSQSSECLHSEEWGWRRPEAVEAWGKS